MWSSIIINCFLKRNLTNAAWMQYHLKWLSRFTWCTSWQAFSLVFLAIRATNLTNLKTKFFKIASHDALIFLRISLKHPRIIYVLPACSCFVDGRAFKCLNKAFRSTFVSCVCLKTSDDSWSRATTPFFDGIGLQSSDDFVVPACLSSVFSTRSLSDQLCACSTNSFKSDALSFWAVATGSEQPPAKIVCLTSS